MVFALFIVFYGYSLYRHFVPAGDVQGVMIVSPEPDPTPVITPTPTITLAPTATPTPTPQPSNTMQKADIWVGQYVDHYFNQAGQRSEARMIMHCLLNRETKHDYIKGQGDGGRALGVLQWHLPTWERARKEMIRQGETDSISHPENLQDAIQSTVWAMSESAKPRSQRVISILEWGPVLRESQGKDNATCPVPTWTRR